jgi:leucyl aminopeptidase (aminopeptidase T)
VEALTALARKILSESLNVKSGESVTIETWSNGVSFASQVALEAKRIGASPLVILEDEASYIEAAKTVPKENLGNMGEHESALLSKTNAYVFIPGPPLAFYSELIDQQARSASTAYNNSWYAAAATARLRGVRLNHGYLGREAAVMLGKDLDEMVRHMIEASLCDYQEIKKRARKLTESLRDDELMVLNCRGSTLQFAFKGDLTVEDGVVDDEDLKIEENMAAIPPGIVRKQVDSKSVHGTILCDAPLTRQGMIGGVKLRFEKGQLVEWNAESNKEGLDRMIQKIPEEKRGITRASIGLNPLLKQGYSQDSFVEGIVGITVGYFGLSAVVQSAHLHGGGKTLIDNGTLL